MKLKEARERFLRVCQVRIKNQEMLRFYSRVLAEFVSYVGNLDLERFSAQNVREYMLSFPIARRRYGITFPRPASQYYAVVRIWIEWCQSKRLLKRTLWAGEVEGHFQYISSRSFRSRPAAAF